jgi:hypothetical protein
VGENAEFELDVLADIYVKRGWTCEAGSRATDGEARTAHAREELGISEITTNRLSKPN